jgi:hypothetical protein
MDVQQYYRTRFITPSVLLCHGGFEGLLLLLLLLLLC